ncbi:MAG: nucleoside-diphosphate sugar epimerase/dehydratase [Cyclobacteriaceae bacterium]
MLSRFVNRLTVLPRWIIILIDSVFIAGATVAGYLIRFNFQWKYAILFNIHLSITVTVMAALIATFATKSYAGIVRYTGVDDGFRIFYTALFSLGIASLTNLIYYYNSGKNLIPYSVLLIVFLASFVFLFYYRLVVKTIFTYYKSDVSNKKRVAIFGAGQAGVITKNAIDSDTKGNLKVIAFFEDDQSKVGKVISSNKIYDATKDFNAVVERYNISQVIFAIEDIEPARKNEMVELCLGKKIQVRSIPSVRTWVGGELNVSEIKEVNIEDLLGRESIQIGKDHLYKEFRSKTIVVTGAAGSIGSELVRQLVTYNPSTLILIDQAETQLYDIECELLGKQSSVKILSFVADICNKTRLNYVFAQFKIDILFHAAAYKHVPVMEKNPYEAVYCNVLGTRTLADLAIDYGIRKFVMVSTDKAVNPTSIMGCSKRIAEIYVQSLNNFHESMGLSHTSFVTTRFGNVLGSNGSVIPLFKRQIASGGPITVTHPEITRYFMTIPEASSLVLEAGVMGNGGEIFLFDMGKPIKIHDLARKMILLSGFEEGKDIKIVFTGLREGEKLYEELLGGRENSIPTHHSKILKAKVSEYSFDKISNMVDLLIELASDKNELKMVTLMKEIVPEFKSNYSRFELLDN